VFLVSQPDGDAGVHISGEIQITDGASVDTAFSSLQLCDDLARPHLRRTGECSGWENGVDGIDRIAIRVDFAAYCGTDVHDMGESHDRSVGFYLDGTEAADAS